jgi:hypothetical protein
MANADLTEEFKILKLQDLYKKVSDLTNENENLRKELNKYKSEENISLQIIEKEKPSIVENDEKMYEQILNPSENTSKKVLMNNMFKLVPEPTPSDNDESGEEEDEEEDDENDDEDDDEDDEDEDEENEEKKEESELLTIEPVVSDEEEESELEEEESKLEEEESELEEEEEDEEEESKLEEEESELEKKEEEKPLTKTEEEDDVETENEEDEDVEDEDEEEEDVFEIEIDDVTYFTNNEENGSIYMVDQNGDPGKKIGHLKEGEPFFISVI